jgi:hypothetical protein
MPSMVFWKQGTGGSQTGKLVLGQEADELSPAAPWCLERTPKSRLAAGDETMLLGEQELRVVEVIGQILQEVTAEALALSGGQRPAEVRLTHPARWARPRLERLRMAAQSAGISDPIFIPEPIAAATHFASERLSEGDHVAVYDLGGGTLDTAVLRRVGDSFELAGRPGGEASLGGENFDDHLYRYLGEKLPGETWQRLRHANDGRERVWAHANRQLLRDARRAKERLSSRNEADLLLGPPIDTELQVTAPEFEALISSSLSLSVGELERTILAAGLKPADLAAVYLAGASSRIPLVTRLISERLGVLPERLDDPKAVTALGAARLPTARRPEARSEPQAPPPPVVARGGAPASQTAPTERPHARVAQETEHASTGPQQPAPVQGETMLEQKPPPPPPPPAPPPAEPGHLGPLGPNAVGGLPADELPQHLALRLRLAAIGVAAAGAVIIGAMFLKWPDEEVTYWQIFTLNDIVGAVLGSALITVGLFGAVQESWGRRVAPALMMLGAIAFGYFFFGAIELLAAERVSPGAGAWLLSVASCAALVAGAMAFGISAYDSDRSPPPLYLGPDQLWASVAIFAAAAIVASYFLNYIGEIAFWEGNSAYDICGTVLAAAMVASALGALASSRLALRAFPVLAAANFGFNNPFFSAVDIQIYQFEISLGAVGTGFWIGFAAGVVLLVSGIAMLDRRAWSPGNA